MMRKQRNNTRISVEPLENRLLLAGDVQATVVGGNLFITGDNLDNRISITNGANPGEVDITGWDDSAGNPTGVGGTPNGTVTKTGVTGNIVVSLRGGADVVAAHDLDAPKNLVLSTEDGNDGVAIGAAATDAAGVVYPDLAAAAAAANLPAGLVAAGPVTVTGALLVNTGPGNDIVSQSELTVNQQTVVNTGVGSDHVFLGRATAGDAASGVSSKDLIVNLGRDADSVSAFGADIKRALAIADVGGVTEIDLHSIAVNHAAIIMQGAGNDTVAIKDMHALNVAILGDAVSETVKIEDSTFKRLEVLLFGGNDTLEIGNTTVTTQGFLDGGAGTGDTYDQLTPNTFTNVKKVRFEINT